ncbi:T9SS type B sorting domain-containing protein [Phaeocystidibacter marisrubri]|uniref:T9SS type B sorting domain-containing protein n=1 Tax=Phaeocystidibacter marisrubri TaxID=1577780 RepID=A0A6L3ZGN0_9FLAO|nr:T9SS type B sorting domain-containing protein [Phaeocystidibacter marisrubri]KAB2817186.1 T9SS type B sorting domain-containing protein [Phaeocystidibacter marisrubri]
MDTICALGGPSNLAVPATSGATYHWYVSAGTILNGQGTSDITVDWPRQQGLYDTYVVETSSDGCVGDTIKGQVFIAEPNSTFITGPSYACRGQFVELNAIDSKNTGKFIWNSGDSTNTIGFVAKRDTTIFRVALNDECENDTVFHLVRVLDVPVISVDTDAQSDTLSAGSLVNFQYMGNQSETVDWYLNSLWMGSGLSMDMTFSQVGWNELQIIASSGMCSDTLNHRLWVEDEFRVHAPTAFSPNGDGLNDIWKFEGLGYLKYEVTIYDRWGTIIAHWDDENPSGWDGTYQGNTVAPGVYTFRASAYTTYNHKKEFGGPITVIR